MMEVTLNLKHLAGNLAATLMVLIVNTMQAQVDKPVEIPFDNEIIAAYIDRPGDLYVTFSNDVIRKFDLDGKELAKGKFGNPTIFDPWYGIHVLMYNKNENFYTVTNRNLEDPKKIYIDSALVIEPSLICFSGEKSIWVLDKADMSLKRINPTESKVEAESIIPAAITAGRDFINIREYQNFVFLQDSNGKISVFNQLGIHVRDIQTPGLKTFNFLGEELYYYTAGQVMFFDLFDARLRSKQVESHLKSVLLTGNKSILVYTRKIVVQSANP